MATVDLDKWHPTHVYLAFWLQDKIKREGLEGIHYMEHAQRWAVRNADDVVADSIDSEFNKL